MNRPPPIDTLVPEASSSASPSGAIPREAELHAYVDDQLDARSRHQVDVRLAEDEAARAAVAAWQAQADAVRALQREVLDQPIPQRLVAAATGHPVAQAAGAARGSSASSASSTSSSSSAASARGGKPGAPTRSTSTGSRGHWRRAGRSGFGGRLFGERLFTSGSLPRAAFALLMLGLGVAAGWLARPLMEGPGHAEGAGIELAAGATASQAAGVLATQYSPNSQDPTRRGLLREALVAHAVYSVDARRPVEVAASEQDQLLRWLSRRLGQPLTLPRLDAQGYRLVGGRLLPGDTQGAAGATRAQFMYEDSGGQRLTLYLGVLGEDTMAPASAGTTAPGADARPTSATSPPSPISELPLASFSWARRGPLQSFYWTEGRFAYALSGELSHEALAQLSQTVYHQLRP
ncbi:MAG: hypothetical protein RL722_1331 [Pseudomonadota bacterium]|jgi:anti-sigma factor RsiW